MVDATPLPPRNPRKHEKQWPSRAPTKPAAWVSKEGAPWVAQATSRAGSQAPAAPLSASRAKTRFPGPLPMTRLTLVAPGLPDPADRMSTPWRRATITAKLTDPMR